MTENKPKAVPINEFPLDPAARTLVAEINNTIEGLLAQRSGALTLVVRLNKLDGNWQLHPDGTKLIRADAPQPEKTQ